MMMELHVVSRKTGETMGAFALGDTAEVIIGRDESCDVRIAAPSVSREHCVIEQVNGVYHIRDLESTGGTICDGRPIEEMPLTDGLEVVVGPTLLRFIDGI